MNWAMKERRPRYYRCAGMNRGLGLDRTNAGRSCGQSQSTSCNSWVASSRFWDRNPSIHGVLVLLLGYTPGVGWNESTLVHESALLPAPTVVGLCQLGQSLTRWQDDVTGCFPMY